MVAAKVSKTVKISEPMKAPAGCPRPPITLMISTFTVAPRPMEPGEMPML
jgi:hypothetical protein